MNKTVYASIVKGILEDNGYDVKLSDNVRNNCSFVSLCIKNGKKVSPVFNIGDDEEQTPEEFAKHIMSFKIDDIDADKLNNIMLDKSEVLKRVTYVLVNKKLNEKRKSIVRSNVCDTLEKHYRLDVSDQLKDARIILETKHLDLSGVTMSDIDEAATKNTVKKMPLSIKNMCDILPCLDRSVDLFVLSNENSFYGAGAILYKGVKKEIEKYVGEDFVLLPSSVHEWIIAPHEFEDIEVMTKIIRDVNVSTVKPDEILSDVPYKLFSDGKLVEA